MVYFPADGALMNTLSLRRAFVLFHLTLGIVVLVQSIRTIATATHGNGANPLGSHLILLAGAEAIAALLFLIPGTLKIGSALLLLIFAIAVTLHGAQHQVDLLVYASGVVFVTMHGSAYSKELLRF
jgi:hypothetical protein